MKAQRADLHVKEKQTFSQLLLQNLLPFCMDIKPKVVHSFIPFNNEPDILPLLNYILERDIMVVVPKTLKGRKMEHRQYTGEACLAKGLFGTPYPNTGIVFKGKFDMILVPGLAFDKKGYRLGYGGGYYDQFLANHLKAIKIGVIYPFQYVDVVPTEPHDQAVDYLFTGEVISVNST